MSTVVAIAALGTKCIAGSTERRVDGLRSASTRLE